VLLLDCRTLAVTPIAIPESVEILVVHSGLPRHLEASEYAARRAACDAVAARLGLPNLREASEQDVEGEPFARHVVRENERVHAFAGALLAHDFDRCGRLMSESHASLRDDFAVSTPELDLLVTLLTDAGAYGARLTGAGFGGCVVALAPHGAPASFLATVCNRYRAATGLESHAFVVRSVDGAGEMPVDEMPADESRGGRRADDLHPHHRR
jgi:galactokinase